ncbi:calcineurin-like phosphoesterase C-terminal domain-containing protein [Planctomycetota bacterium]
MSRYAFMLLLLVVCFGAVLTGTAYAEQIASGYVYVDENGNGQREASEQGLGGVRVSNGREVVATDSSGRYELKVKDDTVIFLIKPRDYMVALDENNLPKFYYVHKPSGSPIELEYRGVAPTGALPESVDFGLIRRPEKDEFEVIIFGDPQPNNIGDINHLAHDIVEELVGTNAAFGTALGDLMADLLNLYEPYNNVMGRIGIALFNVPGNHDMNLDVNSDELANETWKRILGPATYSFNWGAVHFICVDDVIYHGEGESYSGGFNEQQLEFIKNDLKYVPKDALVVLMMHIPLDEVDASVLFSLLKDRDYTLSLAGHNHEIRQLFIGADEGWEGSGLHHHVVAGATCGIHWLGVKDEYGIPAAMTHCGSPNGYLIVTFNGNQYKIRFKAPRRPADEQMHIYTPDMIKASDAGETEVVVNVFFGSERSRVQMKLDDSKQWTLLSRQAREDPYLQKVVPEGHPLSMVTHLWVGKLPANLSRGGHVIYVRTKDMFGQEYTAHRVIRVE